MFYVVAGIGVPIFVVAVIAYLVAGSRLRVQATNSIYRCRLAEIEHGIRAGVVGLDLSPEDLWLAGQIVGNAIAYRTRSGLRTNLGTLHRNAHDKSRDRELYVRRLLRALRDTQVACLRDGMRRLLLTVHDLASENSGRVPVVGRVVVHRHAEHPQDTSPEILCAPVPSLASLAA